MIRVKSIMTRNVISVPLSSSLKEAANLMLSKSVSCLLIVDENKPVGVLSESNIIKGAVAKKAKVKDIMSRNFIVISPKTKFSEISKALRERKIKIFPVIENGSLAGLVAETDIIQATRDFTRFHQIFQEIILSVFGLATAFFLFYFSPIFR